MEVGISLNTEIKVFDWKRQKQKTKHWTPSIQWEYELKKIAITLLNHITIQVQWSIYTLETILVTDLVARHSMRSFNEIIIWL